MTMLISQPRVHAPGLSPHPPLAQDTLRVDRADLMRLPCPLSGAHFNPVVSAAFTLRCELPPAQLLSYVLAQIAGGVAGSSLAHGMFDLPLLQFSVTVRTGVGQWLGEM